jgi:hypothetical protein
MNDARKQELAFLYAADALEAEDKPVVFHLVLHDPAFRQFLKEEVELRAKLRSLRMPMDPFDRSRLYASMQQQIKPSRAKPDADVPNWLHWSEFALRLTLPSRLFPMIKTIQRRWGT